jgi:hypothetical protein
MFSANLKLVRNIKLKEIGHLRVHLFAINVVYKHKFANCSQILWKGTCTIGALMIAGKFLVVSIFPKAFLLQEN